VGRHENISKFPIKFIDMNSTFLNAVFPKELLDHFEITDHQVLCKVDDKLEYWIIDFEERNHIPKGFKSEDYESKGFHRACIVQDFPIRGKGVFLRIKRRRWRHKQSGEVIQSDFSFIADGSKFTSELSDFLKDANRYATRYHDKYSQLLFGESQEVATAL
jgi:hypothetical protein